MEKMYRVEMNSKGMPNFATAKEVADRPSAVDLSSVYSTAYKSGYEKGKADRPQGEWIFKTVFPNDKSEFPMGYLECPVCGSHHSNSTPCNYCDNCGARLKGADDE